MKNNYAEDAAVLGRITPSEMSEALLNLSKEINQECAYLADVLIGSFPTASGAELKSVSSSGLFGVIADNNSDSQEQLREAKSHISRIRNAIGK